MFGLINMHINKIVHTNSGKVHKLMLTFFIFTCGTPRSRCSASLCRRRSRIACRGRRCALASGGGGPWRRTSRRGTARWGNHSMKVQVLSKYAKTCTIWMSKTQQRFAAGLNIDVMIATTKLRWIIPRRKHVFNIFLCSEDWGATSDRSK